MEPVRSPLTHCLSFLTAHPITARAEVGSATASRGCVKNVFDGSFINLSVINCKHFFTLPVIFFRPGNIIGKKGFDLSEKLWIMEPMKVDISMYDALRTIAKAHKVKNKHWAAASGMKEPRISELNLISREGEQYGRVCTLDKVIALYNGLVKLLGEGQVRQDLKTLLDKETDVTKRLIIMCLMLGEAGEQYRSQAEMFLQTLLRSIRNEE